MIHVVLLVTLIKKLSMPRKYCYCAHGKMNQFKFNQLKLFFQMSNRDMILLFVDMDTRDAQKNNEWNFGWGVREREKLLSETLN
jgi:hypothetical protein